MGQGTRTLMPRAQFENRKKKLISRAPTGKLSPKKRALSELKQLNHHPRALASGNSKLPAQGSALI